MDTLPRASVKNSIGITKMVSNDALVGRVLLMKDDLDRILCETQRALVEVGSPDSVGHSVLGIRAVSEVIELLASKGAENAKASKTLEKES